MNNFIIELVRALGKIEAHKLEKLKDVIYNTKGMVLVLGNGGSNAIASHIAEDYTKALKIVSTSFSDAARLTCYANDYGYENAFREYVKEFSQPDGLVILISSSGNSKNIVNCADYCQKHGLQYIILTGFNENNKLREYAEDAILDFWVDSTDYGIVECTHEIILHSII